MEITVRPPSALANNDSKVLTSEDNAAHAPTFDPPDYILQLIAGNLTNGCIYMYRAEDWDILDVARKRTWRQAEAVGAITEFPRKLAVVTLEQYANALTLNKDKIAYIRPVNPAEAQKLHYKDGALYRHGMAISSKELESIPASADNGAMPSIDLSTLQCLYSLALLDVESVSGGNPDMLRKMHKDPRYIEKPIRIFVRDLLKWTGYVPNSSRDTVNNMVRRVRNLQAVFGLLADDNDRQQPYPVLDAWEHDGETNTVCFRVPYLRKLAINVLLAGIKHNKLSHSYLLCPSIAKRRGDLDNEVFEVVSAIIRLIERAGGKGAHIKTGTLLDRCPCLRNTLDGTDPTNQHTVLTRVLRRAWADLKEHTSLSADYDKFEFPDKNAKYSPCRKGLNKKIEFSHNGKKRTKSKKKQTNT